ncbi:MAG: signal recognition particle-docking protein FtsY [Deltaproteobacteria bacterium]|nr:signal recognition particle-docking protein FtsY [Deltaproteobacteria bacterium]
MEAIAIEVGLGLLSGVFIFGAVWFLWKKKTKKVVQKVLESPSEGAKKRLEDVSHLFPSLGDKLQKTRGFLFDRLTQILQKNVSNQLSPQEWNLIEEVLLEADIGYSTSQQLLTAAKARLNEKTEGELRGVIREVSKSLFDSLNHGRLEIKEQTKPVVISVVGINGAGKTTTIGKLTQQLMNEGKVVLLGAVDTFRAGAISQLKVWADRTGAQFVTGREGADPGAVAFDSVTAGKAREVDVVLLDTAGRLHTKANLMEELKKIHRVIKKVIPEAPHETWLVIDGTLGQNSVIQAKEFQKSLDLTGVIITKLDGTAKGGAVFSIASELKLPIRYIGVGESIEDLTPFEPKAFVDAILS